MAASERYPSSDPASPGGFGWPGPVELEQRLDEEIARAERHGTQLSCLLVVIENLEEMASEHGAELREQALAYAAKALHPELRRFDRIGMPSDRELLVVLPGADGPRGEMVARRVLDRLRAIKVEARGARKPLRVSVGLAAWRPQTDRHALLARARAAAAHPFDGEDGQPATGHPVRGRPTAPAPSAWEPPSPSS